MCCTVACYKQFKLRKYLCKNREKGAKKQRFKGANVQRFRGRKIVRFSKKCDLQSDA
jgi:hypothetical protein